MRAAGRPPPRRHQEAHRLRQSGRRAMSWRAGTFPYKQQRGDREHQERPTQRNEQSSVSPTEHLPNQKADPQTDERPQRAPIRPRQKHSTNKSRPIRVLSLPPPRSRALPIAQKPPLSRDFF